MSEPSWDLYRTFLQVLDTGSLSAAARAMGLTQPTVGRQIELMEKSLGVTLFVRSHEGYSPTDAAHELKPYATSIGLAAAALRRVASSHGSGVRGSVRITVSEVVGVEVLPPIAAKLQQAHPQLTLEVVLSDTADDLLQRQADIAVRMFRPRQDALLATRVGVIEIGLYGHKDYLARHPAPRSFDDLLGHRLIGFDQESVFTRRVLAMLKPLDRSDFRFRADSDLAKLAALRAGCGLGFCQTGIAKRDRKLVRVLPSLITVPMETWIAMHADLRDSPRCQMTFRALVDGLRDYIAAS